MGIIKRNTENRELVTYHNHTYEPKLIKNGGWALDLGCNDFLFVRHLLSTGLKVIGIDPIRNINIPADLKDNSNFIYLQKACVGVKNTNTKTYYEYDAWGANSIYNTPQLLHRPENKGHANNPLKTSYEVELITLEEIMKDYEINQFELIKIDTEGAEYEILDNLPKKCSKQLTIEFHDFLGLTPIKDVELYHKQLLDKLDDYFLSYEQTEPLKGSSTESQRDDVLYILKDFK
jgi:FkbM family methyltransferase